MARRARKRDRDQGVRSAETPGGTTATGPTDAPESDVDAERAARRARDALLVEGVRAGDPDAFGQLYGEWIDRVFELARRIVADDDAAADVAQESFLTAWNKLDTLADPASFGGWLLRITRNGALNHRRRHGRATAVDAETLAMIERSGPSGAGAPAGFRIEDSLAQATDPGVVAEQREASALVLGAAAALAPRDAEVLHLQLRYGLTPAEIGETLGMNRNAANQLVHRAKKRLGTAVEARILWRDGAPRCDALQTEIAAAEIYEFDAATVKLIDAHAARCDECTERKRSRLQPAALFGAVPVLAAPSLLKAKVAHALSDAGVAMQGFEPPASAPFDGDPPEGDGGDGSAPQPPRHPRARVAAIAAAGVAGIMIVALALLVVAFVERAGNGELDEPVVAAAEVAARAPTSSVVPTSVVRSTTTTTTAAATGAATEPVESAAIADPPPATVPTVTEASLPPATNAPPTTVPVTTAPPNVTTVAPTTTPTTVLERSGSISAQCSPSCDALPATAVTVDSAPTLSWSTVGATTVAVIDGSTGQALSTALSGTGLTVCPGSWIGNPPSRCVVDATGSPYSYELWVDGVRVATATIIVA